MSLVWNEDQWGISSPPWCSPSSLAQRLADARILRERGGGEYAGGLYPGGSGQSLPEHGPHARRADYRLGLNEEPGASSRSPRLRGPGQSGIEPW